MKAGEYEFDEEDWCYISKEVKDLIDLMLKMNPKKRITAREALEHPWVTANARDHRLDVKCLKNLSMFTS